MIGTFLNGFTPTINDTNTPSGLAPLPHQIRSDEPVKIQYQQLISHHYYRIV